MPLSVSLDLSNVFTDLCDVMADSPTTGDDGHTVSTASVVVATQQPCKLLPYVSRKGGSESKAVKKDAKQSYTMYIFPLPVSVENPTGQQITESMWIVIAGKRHDVTDVVDPVVSGAPYEIYLERIKP